MLKIRETRVEDLQAIQRLWADGRGNEVCRIS